MADTIVKKNQADKVFIFFGIVSESPRVYVCRSNCRNDRRNNKAIPLWLAFQSGWVISEVILFHPAFRPLFWAFLHFLNMFNFLNLYLFFYFLLFLIFFLHFLLFYIFNFFFFLFQIDDTYFVLKNKFLLLLLDWNWDTESFLYQWPFCMCISYGRNNSTLCPR